MNDLPRNDIHAFNLHTYFCLENLIPDQPEIIDIHRR